MLRGRLIITGVSSGIGKALAEASLEAGYEVLGVGRRSCDAIESHARGQFFQADLTDPTAVEAIPLLPADSGPTILVNNAGTIGPIASTAEIRHEELAHCMHLNVVAPMRLTARFLQEVEGEKQVYFTGSGAANYPIEGWAAYCASKAAVHQYAEVVSKEHPRVRIHAFRPGKVDTPMQAVIRESSSTAFADKAHFMEAFEQGELVQPQFVAQKLLKVFVSKTEIPVIFSTSNV
jgi:benzil reductase ((S)-benzoin forming)